MFNRLKNIWHLGKFQVRETPLEYQLVKEFPTIKKKSATIIPEEKSDVFTPSTEEVSAVFPMDFHPPSADLWSLPLIIIFWSNL